MIRQAEEKDLQAVAALYEEIHDAEEKGLSTTGWIRGVYPTEDTARNAWKNGELFVEEAGELVGAAIINQKQVDVYADAVWKYDAPEQEVMVLHTLVISPKAKGRGYGREFVHFYEQYARSRNCHYLRMDTNARNQRARLLYQKLGYQEIGIVPTVFNGIEGVELVLLEKKLG